MTRRTVDPSKAVAYLRVSTDEQHLGPEAQRAQILAWGQRCKIEIVEWFEDLDLGGAAAVEKRPGLAGALAALRTHGAGHLIAAKRDRIARDVELAALVGAKVRRAGAVLVTADGASDQQTTEGHLMSRIVDVFAEHERRLIRDRTRSALAVKRARGERISRFPPYGAAMVWDLVDEGRVVRQADEAEVRAAEAARGGSQAPLLVGGYLVQGRLVPHAGEGAALERIEQLAAAGMSLTKIAAELERSGHRSRATSGRWQKTTLARLVRRLENR